MIFSAILKKLGAQPIINNMPVRPGLPRGTLATWGNVHLEVLDSGSLKQLSEGKSIRKGILVDYFWWDKVVTLDPADQQRDDLQTFETRLKNALNRVEKESITYKETERRNILGAIALDKNRYSERFLSHYNLYRWNY